MTLVSDRDDGKQLALPFDERSMSNPRTAPRYRMQRGLLIEDLGAARHVYGAWEHLFGCWRFDRTSASWREIVPTHPIVPDLASPMAYAANAHPVLGAPFPPFVEWKHNMWAAFAAYLGQVPSRLRCLVAGFGRYQWAALDLLWQAPEFGHFLEAELERDRGQFLYAAFTLGRVERLPRRARWAFAHDLMTTRRHALLARLTGDRVPRLAVKALAKMDGGPQQEASYRRLLRVLADPDKAKVLGHMRKVGATTLSVLVALPADLCTPRLVALLVQEPSATELARAIAQVFERLPVERRKAARESLSRVRSAAAVRRWLARWRLRLLELTPYPPPPIPGTSALRPIRSVSELQAEGRVMRNCLASFASEVIQGDVYLYRWSGGERANVLLVRDGENGWRFATALGAANERLGRATEEYLRTIVNWQLSERADFRGVDARSLQQMRTR